MRIRRRKNLKKKNTALALLFLLPLIGFGTYAAGALYILNEMTSFTFKIHSLIWEANIFFDEGGNPDGNGLKENTGMSYVLIYWMGRAFNIF
ncbi:MAG: hypothetical protein ACTSR8_04850 [Promethearchaeota archaeon]